MPKLPRLELLIAFLLVMSLAAFTINNNCSRELTIAPGADWHVNVADDRDNGGTSVGTCEELPSVFRMEYRIADSFHSPYNVLILRRTDGQKLDLSWAETLTVAFRHTGDETAFLCHFRNYEDCSRPDDFTSCKYNESLLCVSDDASSVTLSKEDFDVPSWWSRRYNRTAEQARPKFDQIDSIEFVTMIRQGDGVLEIAGVHVAGQWVASATLMKWLLAIWMGTFFVVLLGRVWCLRKELSDRAESEQELLLANNQLASQSKEMSEMACRDPLTGLFNRRGVRDSIDNLMDEWESNKKRFAVITLDIDHFKKLNDTHGHAHGHDVLCELSRAATLELRSRDVIARWGGEEFVIICAGASEAAAANLAERLRKKFTVGKLGFTCSFGVSESAEGDDFDKILERADLALYRSKTTGRDQVTTFSDLSASVSETLSETGSATAESAQP